MATPRKAWFRVADSILYEGWDDNQIATMVRLCAHLNTRWAREGRSTEDAITTRLSPADIGAISGRLRLDVARKSLERLANVTGMTLRLDGKFTEIKWAKYAIFQGLVPSKSPRASRESPPPQPPPQPPPPPQPQDSTSSVKEGRLPEPSAPLSLSKAKAPKGRKPEQFTGAEYESIRVWAEEKEFSLETLREAMERFREWEPLKQQSRTQKQWVGAFKRICRESVEDGKIGKPTRDNLKPKGGAYVFWKGLDQSEWNEDGTEKHTHPNVGGQNAR